MRNDYESGLVFPFHPSLKRKALWVGCVALVYFAVARLSLSFVSQPEGIAAIWPPAGVFLSAILLTRPNLRPYLIGVLLVLDLILEVLAGTPLLVSAIYALALSGDAVLSSWLLFCFVGGPITFNKAREVFGFLALVVIFSNALFSLVAAAASQLLPGTSYWNSWMWWFASEGIGNLLVTPLTLSWASLTRTSLRTWNPKRGVEGAALFVSLGFMNIIAFMYLVEPGHFFLLLSYATFPFLVWAALRFGVRGMTSALAMLALVAIYFTVASYETNSSLHRAQLDALILLQLYLTVLAIPSLFLAAVVTERKQAHESLRESEEKFRQLIELSPEAIFIGCEGRFVFVNPAFMKLLGVKSPEQLLGRETMEFIHPDYREVVAQRIRSQAPVPLLEEKYFRFDGTLVDVEVAASPIRWGKLPAGQVLVRDITERKRAEQALQQERQLLTALLDNISEAVVACDDQGTLTRFNQAARDLHGLPEEPIPPEQWAAHYDLYQADGKTPLRKEDIPLFRALQGEQIREVEMTVIPKRQTARALVASGQPMYDSDGKLLGAVVAMHDITERKQAEKALRESEARYRLLFETNPQPMWVYDMETLAFVAVNEAAIRHYGYSGDEFLAMTIKDIRPPEDVPALLMDVAKLPQGFRQTSQWRHRKKDGSIIMVEIRSHSLLFANRPARLVLVTDITERHQLEVQFRQSQKMEAIGQLAGGVAHDFNNILTVIQGNASLLLEAKKLSGEDASSAKQILEAAERAAGLTRQLLLFSRKHVMQLASLDINEVVGNMTKMLQRILGEDIALRADYAPNLPLVRADACVMEQVLMNLAVNARDAMPAGGQLMITTVARTVGEEYLRQNPYASLGHCVCLSVSDTGEGIAAEHLPHIFEPFFTTKEVGKGTGLGLATAYGIVKQHGGWIEVASKMNQGTTFQICLPAIEGVRAEQAASPVALELPRGDEVILVVEDEPSVRLLVSNLLQRCGYTVLLAVSGVAALDIWKEHKERIQLLLTDMIMPDGMTGRELAERLSSERPHLKIIYTSGYSADLVGKGPALIEGVNFLQKPYHPLKLAQTVRDCLNRK